MNKHGAFCLVALVDSENVTLEKQMLCKCSHSRSHEH